MPFDILLYFQINKAIIVYMRKTVNPICHGGLKPLRGLSMEFCAKRKTPEANP
jgi:hypothetical protein